MLATLFALSALVFGQPATKQPKQNAPIVISKGIHKGLFLGFTVGDYVHANFGTDKSETKSFWIGADYINYYLALHHRKVVIVQYQTVKLYVPEAGGEITVDQITEASCGSTKYTTWLRNLRKFKSEKQIESEFGPIFEKTRE